MQSIILCAGEGRRASGHTGGANKCLAEVPGHGAILDHSLKAALALTNGAIVVVGHGAGEVQRHVSSFAETNFPRAQVRFVEQTFRDGVCGALLCCEASLGGDDFLLFLGDEIITEPTHANMIEKWSSGGATEERGCWEPGASGGESGVQSAAPDAPEGSPPGRALGEWQVARSFGGRNTMWLASCGYVRAQNIDDVRKTYSLELSGNRVVDIAEKPPNPTNNMMGTGNCLFGNKFLGHIRKYEERRGGALFSFPDVLKYAIGCGETVMGHKIGETYLNFNDACDIAAFLRQTDARRERPWGR
jgi:dTDP-glucose pyrophosphorylase